MWVYTADCISCTDSLLVRCRCRQVGSIFLSYIIHGVASGDHKVHLYSSDNGYALVALSTIRSVGHGSQMTMKPWRLGWHVSRLKSMKTWSKLYSNSKTPVQELRLQLEETHHRWTRSRTWCVFYCCFLPFTSPANLDLLWCERKLFNHWIHLPWATSSTILDDAIGFSEDERLWVKEHNL